MANERAETLGLSPSFGFGDRLGLATPGHIAAARGTGVLPIFAQQSIREMTRTERTPQQVIAAAVKAVSRCGWEHAWGADADHLKSHHDVDITVEAGFVFFTIDPSDHVDRQADDYSAAEVEEKYDALIQRKTYGLTDWMSIYAGKTIDIADSVTIQGDELLVKRAGVKYGAAMAHAADMGAYIDKSMRGRRYEIELSVDETDQPTTPLEHFIIGSELKRLGVNRVVSLAPRYVGNFEKGIDYKGDLASFRQSLGQHMAIANHCGPYKLSVHSGSDKFAIYPVVREVCGTLFHVKTAGTSYLEALRTVGRCESSLFREIIGFSRDRFPIDRATYHISAALDEVPPASDLADEQLEQTYLNEDGGRQILHVTFGSVLTDKVGSAYRFRDQILSTLKANQKIYDEVLLQHFRRHLEPLRV